MAFLIWLQNTTPENRQSLRYVVNISCVDQTTVDVASRALKKDGVKSGVPPKYNPLIFLCGGGKPASANMFARWPGHSSTHIQSGLFSSNDAYEAVLGTRNVLGTDWLILQHQKQLGNKAIGAITVFDSSGLAGGSGLFQLSIMVELVQRSEQLSS